MKHKTLVINKGTKYQEYYGLSDYGWVTASSPINMMPTDITWGKIKETHKDNDFNGVDLVTIEIKVIDG